MYVVSLTKLDKGKVKICLDNGTDFTLYKAEVAHFELEEDKELSQSAYEQILTDILIPRCKKRGLHLLEKQDRTEANLREKLLAGGYPEFVVDEAIAYIDSFGYIDDERMARSHIRFYQNSRSKRRIKQDLLHKGIDSEVIERCIEEEYETDEVELAVIALQKRNYNFEESTYEERNKAYRFLVSRGFSSDVISKVIHNMSL